MKSKKPASVAGRRWGFMKKFEIMDRAEPDRVYLRRWYLIQTPYGSLYLHHILLPDTDRDPHDHPWNFTTIPLTGSYTQTITECASESPSGSLWSKRIVTLRRWHPARLSQGQYHQINQIHSADGTVWTLCLVGPRRGSWGFLTRKGHVDWQEYLDEAA